jgi:hypothetical protein
VASLLSGKPVHHVLAATAHWHLTSTEVAAGAAALVAAVSIASLIVTNTTTNGRDRRKALVELWTQRLNELYAPIVLLLDQDRIMHRRMKQGKAENWHMLDNVETIRADPVDSRLAQNIIDVNQRIRAILETKAGLVGDQVPASFAKFLTHQDMLAAAFTGLPFVKQPEDLTYFPKDFETDIRDGYTKVLKNMRKEMGQL